MIVLILTACPVGLRGFLTRWLLEVAPGVFIGKVSSRIREDVWGMTVELARNGRSILIFPASNEQGFDFKVHHHSWVPTDFDGLQLISRPLPKKISKFSGAEATEEASESPFLPRNSDSAPPPVKGWSKASIFRRARKM